MSSIFDLLDPAAHPFAERMEADLQGRIDRVTGRARAETDGVARSAEILATAAARHVRRISGTHAERLREGLEQTRALAGALREARGSGGLGAHLSEYLLDAAQRAALTADALRKRGDIFLEHEAADCPPVLIYGHETIMEGKDLPFPSNYKLLRILPPEGVVIGETRRPYVVIDPRAGHGPGIGGFKPDSQVGVALREGHPVYFVSFGRRPEPGQYLSHVTRAEAAFLREIMRRHPDSPKPVVIGNCQGGWATLLLAALNPDLTGPIVVNGAPVAPWAGKVGQDPMRYKGGLTGGSWVAMFFADLGGGIFDGAHLVRNFEMLNPGRTLFRKYTDLFRDVDDCERTFLDFERWWGGFFLLTEREIRWIVEQLFVGNRLVKNEARLEPGRPIDLKAIRAPIIVFASQGDNITPPQQALNWIAETYADAAEIRIRGQRIVYMLHEEVGHLGIFVSSKIARKEHAQVASTLKTIEALAPGLYEMRIEEMVEQNGEKRFTVSFVERSLDDLRALDDGFSDERPFAAVARLSEAQAQLYDGALRPWIQAMVTDSSAELGRATHPLRLERALVSSRNPASRIVVRLAEQARATRARAAPENPFLAAEALWVRNVEQSIDLWRDLRDMAQELTFFSLWGSPWARFYGRNHEARRTLKTADELRGLPEVVETLAGIGKGGLPEAVLRMLVLLAEERRQVRRDRLERLSRMLEEEEPFASLGAERRARILQSQTLIAAYEPLRAVETLPALLPGRAERELALKAALYVLGPLKEATPPALALLGRIAEALGLPEALEDVTESPLAGFAFLDDKRAAEALLPIGPPPAEPSPAGLPSAAPLNEV
ncbi:DUF3141 domain-containing protein [Neomegalonema sp.]|uniref:DUF3141 domain-containing protein n=1 Tax=Neomegalonema sp. TaxID=2039713 RepID=UPI002631F5AE|nr:DUF3141 domain-containing protein [Neomegalonema sp.]MDD2867373.1 alpha/beta fold hydrolase [Neomegalonema sp.]